MHYQHSLIEAFKHLNYNLTTEEYARTRAFFSTSRAMLREQLEKLSWDASCDEQHTAIRTLAKDLTPSEYIYLVLPGKYTELDSVLYKQYTGKSQWENAAKVLAAIGWPKVDHIVVPLFMWLLDPNWPGSELIYKLIVSIPKDVLANKMRIILRNPSNYEERDFADIKLIIDDLCESLQLDL